MFIVHDVSAVGVHLHLHHVWVYGTIQTLMKDALVLPRIPFEHEADSHITFLLRSRSFLMTSLTQSAPTLKQHSEAQLPLGLT